MPQTIHRVLFTISPERDFEGYLKLAEQFPKNVLNSGLKKTYPDLIQEEDADSVRKLLFDQFNKQSKIIEERTAEVEKLWLDIEETFYSLSRDVCRHFDLNKQYVAYPSLLSHFIRDLDKGVLSFPINKPPEHGVFVVCHELLHFFFFDYLFTHYPDLRKKEAENFVWVFSEVLNVLIQEQEYWVALTGITPSYYPQQKELYDLMRPRWLREKNIDLLIHEFCLTQHSDSRPRN
jgi:hypothetical protein